MVCRSARQAYFSPDGVGRSTAALTQGIVERPHAKSLIEELGKTFGGAPTRPLRQVAVILLAGGSVGYRSIVSQQKHDIGYEMTFDDKWA